MKKQKYLNIFSAVVLLSLNARALTCEKEFALRSENEAQVLKDLALFEAKASQAAKTSSAASLSYQQKLAENLRNAKSEIFDLQRKFQLAKNKLQSFDIDPVKTSEVRTKQTVKGDFIKVASLEGTGGLVRSLQLEDGRIVTISDAYLRVWTEKPNGTYHSVELSVHSEHINTVVALKDGRLVTGADDHTLRVWTPNQNGSFDSTMELVGHKASVYLIRQLKDGRILSGSSDGTLWVWSLKSDGTYDSIELTGHTHAPHSLGELPDGRLMSASYDGTVRVWTLRPDGIYNSMVLSAERDHLESTTVLKNGKIVSGYKDGFLRVWIPKPDESYTFVELREVRPFTGYVSPYILELRDGRFAAAAEDGNIRIWTEDPNGKFSSIVLTGTAQGKISGILELKDGRIAAGYYVGFPYRVWTLNSDGTSNSVTFSDPKGNGPFFAELNDGKIITSNTKNSATIWHDPIIQSDNL